ncbi:Vmc-like lipoprotein signal peptide domain-containing protein [Metamycoplasma buccale]|uniref:Vmc-like lipoprotein signal peptide domain-containing protein n=1 Tax=Metamycoplasma buccale TaxID=55602 RepID=UPI00398ECE35
MKKSKILLATLSPIAAIFPIAAIAAACNDAPSQKALEEAQKATTIQNLVKETEKAKDENGKEIDKETGYYLWDKKEQTVEEANKSADLKNKVNVKDTHELIDVTLEKTEDDSTMAALKVRVKDKKTLKISTVTFWVKGFKATK